MIIRTENFQKTVKETSTSDAIMTMISIIPLVVGLAIVIGHNRWVYDWTVVVTILGWIILGAAIVRLFFHKMVMRKMAEKAESRSFFTILGIVFLFIGFGVAYLGFWG